MKQKKNGISRQSKILFFLLISALVVRIAAMMWAFQFRENTDVLRYRDWGRIAYLYGMHDTYKPDHLSFGTLPNNQPPGSTYIINSAYQLNILAAKVYLKIGGDTETNRQNAGIYIQNALLRLPQILADLTLGYLIFVLVKKFNPKYALLAAGLYLFNPIVIYNSSFWGQMDSLNNIFLFTSLFLLLKKKYFLAILCFFCCLYVKISLIFLIPLFFLTIYKSLSEKKKVIGYSTAAAGLLFLATLPISRNPATWFINFFTTNSLGEMQYITNFALNFWWSIYRPAITGIGNQNLFDFSEIRLSGSPLDNTPFLGIPLAIWGVGLFLLFSAPLWIKLYNQKKISPHLLFAVFSLTALLGFLFLPRMHERYLYPFFPLFAAFIGLTNRYAKHYITLALLNMLNVYIAWHPMKLFFFPYELIYNIWFQWIISVMTLVVSTLLYLHMKKNLTAT